MTPGFATYRRARVITCEFNGGLFKRSEKNVVSDRNIGAESVLVFLKKHRHNWERDHSAQGAVVLVAGDADRLLGMKYTPLLPRAAEEGVKETNAKVKAAVYDKQWTRAVILAIRAFQASVKLGMDEFISEGLRVLANNAMREAMVIERE